MSTTTPETAPDPEPGRLRRPDATADAPGGRPLTGRRVLVLGGTHAQASAARSHVVGLGGSAAVNLSASVTEVVALPGGDADRRIHRVVSLGLPVRDVAWLQALNRTEGTDGAAVRPEAALILPRGGVIDLPVTVGATRWTVAASWRQQAECEIDVVAFILDEDEQVSCDEDFVFCGAPEHRSGNVRLSVDGPEEQSIHVDLTELPAAAHKIAIAAAIDGTATFGDAGAIEISASPGTGETVLAQATLDAATTERTLICQSGSRVAPPFRGGVVRPGERRPHRRTREQGATSSMTGVDGILWRKSTRSGGGNTCVEVTARGDRHLVRDSKNPDGGVLVFRPAVWRTFVDDVKQGRHGL